MSAFKRKRDVLGVGASVGARMPYKTPQKRSKRRPFVPGADRRAGFYGRYAGRGGELKFHDVDLDDATVASGGVITETINIIPQGVTEVQRIGRKCTIRSIFWKFTIDVPARDANATPSAGDELRVVLYLDKQANGAAAATTDIFESADIHSFRNLANSGRFQILYDKLHVMNYIGGMGSDGAGVVSQPGVKRSTSVAKKCNIPIEFSSTTGAMGEIRSNNLGVCLLGSTGVAGFNSKFRLRFSDV